MRACSTRSSISRHCRSSQGAFRRVDHGYPLQVATLARKHGATTCALNSAMGANAGSSIFYNRVKGELEDALSALGYPSLVLVRPGLIDGERERPRTAQSFCVQKADIAAADRARQLAADAKAGDFAAAALLRVDAALERDLERHLRTFLQYVLDRDIASSRLMDELARLPRPTISPVA